MSYCTAEEVRGTLKISALDSIIGDEFIEDEVEKEEKLQLIINEAICDAEGEIDGYLNKRYPTPLGNAPKVINKFCKDIAIYNIFSRRGIEEGTSEENYLVRYKAAIKFLENVAKGLIDIGTGGQQQEPLPRQATDIKVHSNQRLFSRNTLRGM